MDQSDLFADQPRVAAGGARGNDEALPLTPVSG
jgi:hypothetical protein